MDNSWSWPSWARPSTTPSVSQMEIIVATIIKIEVIKLITTIITIIIDVVVLVVVNNKDRHQTQSQIIHPMHQVTPNKPRRTRARRRTTAILIALKRSINIWLVVIVMTLPMKRNLMTLKRTKLDTLPSSTRHRAIHEAVQTDLAAPPIQEVQTSMARQCSVLSSKEIN